MSLLLDALKKAADDKKKISQAVANEASAEVAVVEASFESVAEAGEKLTLDPLDTEEPVEVTEELDVAPETRVSDDEESKLSAKPDKDLNDTNNTSYTVSDEALSMLICKTNRDVKKSRRFFIISVVLASLAILVSGGVYYYMDMQAGIAALERKHQIAIHSMELKTNKEKAPEKSKIIRNLVGDSGLNDKVQYAKNHIAGKHQSQQAKPVIRPALNAASGKDVVTSSAVSFKKTNKADPVTEKLEQAWQAYEVSQYGRAKELYKEILAIEKNNRDAMLGLGAIAIIEKDNVAARSIYTVLLKRDPRDPIANAALASLRNSATAVDEKYLLEMLQKNPDDAQLNFVLGNVYAQQGKWKSAQKSYFSAWQHDNENADYIFNLAVSMDQLGKQQQAVAFYQKCLNRSVNKQVVFSREAVQKRITELSEL